MDYLNNLEIRLIRNNTIKIKNKILAMLSAPEAMPPKPKIAATIAMIMKIIVQRNIILIFVISDAKLSILLIEHV